MDPISNVASIFAIISLALQLGQSALKIKQFLDTINDAPAEIIRLSDVVLQLNLIAEGINVVLERQKESHCQNTNICNNIYNALKTCQNRLHSIENILRMAEKVTSGQNSLSRNWAQFRLAWKKEKIEEFEEQLQRATSFLNTNLILCLMDSNTMLSLEFKSFSQLFLTYQESLSIKHKRTCIPRNQGTTSTSLMTSIISNPSGASTHMTCPNERQFHVQRYRIGGKHQKQSVLFEVKISKSYTITVRLYKPFSGVEYSIPFNISIQNLIPANAAVLKACEIGDSERVRLLLKSRTVRPNDRTSDNRTLLDTAIRGGHEEVVQLLLREGADPNLPSGRFQISPMQIGIYLEKLGIVRILIQRGADPEYNSTQGWSLLHYLFDEGKSMDKTQYFSILKDCLSFDDTQDGEGWTALHRCAAFGSSEDVRFLHLLGTSAYSNRYVTNKGWSPIHVASIMNNVSTLEALVDLQENHLQPQGIHKEGFDALNCVDINGWTPLHLAAHRGSIDTMKWLLRHGANPYQTTYGTAAWYPEGHEGKAFQASDLAILSQSYCLKEFIKTLQDIGYDIAMEGTDIYWPSETGINEDE